MDFSEVQLITTKELADRLRVSPMTVYRLVKSGGIPHIRVGKNFRFAWDDVAATLEETSIAPEGVVDIENDGEFEPE